MTTESKLTRKQERKFQGEYTESVKEYVVIATVRHDDRCGNGHNTFSITANVYGPDGCARDGVATTASGRRVTMESGGCCHKAVARAIPELAPYLKWHLVSTDGPMNYVSNTVYQAGDRDCWGLRAGEKRQIRNGKTGMPCWVLEADKELPKYVDADTQPTDTATLRYVPWCREGEGKAMDLDAARRCAVWPDATDAQLMQEPEALKQALLARLPALMAEFRAAVEALGFTY